MKKIIISMCLSICVLQVSAAAVTGFYYTPGFPRTSYIAQSVATTLNPGSDWAFVSPYNAYEGYNAIDFGMRGPQYSGGWWDIQLWAPNNGLLQIGTYTATRFPFQDRVNVMGFNWSGSGRGCNVSLSWVNILEVEYTNGLVSKFAVDFVQAEEVDGRTVIDPINDRWAYGSYRYNSTIPLNTTVPIPEPSTFALIGLGLGFSSFRRRK